MLDSYIATFKKYAEFSGRATRSEYWTFVLGNIVVAILFGILGAIFTQISDVLGGIIGLLYFVFAIGIILPQLGVLVRRLHDTGRSGWWYWISLVPLVGFIILLVFLLTDSTDDNEYGPNPKKAQAE